MISKFSGKTYGITINISSFFIQVINQLDFECAHFFIGAQWGHYFVDRQWEQEIYGKLAAKNRFENQSSCGNIGGT